MRELPGRHPNRARRAAWLIRTGWAPLLWIAAAAAALLHDLLAGGDGWLPVHLALLGAVSNVIVVWSAHFANAVLRTRDDGHAGQARRLVALNAGVLTVVAGEVQDVLPVLVAGAVLVALAVLAHAWWLLARLRRSLPARFSRVVRYYVAAAAMLVVGICLGVALEAGAGGDAWAPRLLVAHLTLNVVGWVSLTVVGTLVTLWPTMLRTPMGDGSETVAFAALPLLVMAVTTSALGALLGRHVVSSLGDLAFLVVLVAVGRPLVRQARSKPPRELGALSVLAGCLWFVAGIPILAWAELRAGSWESVADTIGSVVLPMLVLGFAVQTVIGALTYLVPVMLGGGPDAVRRSIVRVQRGGRVRLVMGNAALVGAVVLPRADARALCLAACVVVLLLDVGVLALGAVSARTRAAVP
ncbi:MAG: hypothetical protein GC157_12645 [Frankiales bacterium]|nr:hypothetical protein [Frankiales bacterium]